MATYPISAHCPNCGPAPYKRVKPEAVIAFAKDRVCERCGVRYTPPTPRWAAWVFVIIGAAILALLVPAMPWAFLLGDKKPNISGSTEYGGYLGIACGLGALVFGVRKLFKPDPTGTTAAGPNPTEGPARRPVCSICGATLQAGDQALGLCPSCRKRST